METSFSDAFERQLHAALQAVIRRNLRAWRRAKGLKQDTVARDAGYAHHSSISKFERGKRRVPLEKLPALAFALGIRVEDLVREEPLPAS